MRTVDDAIRLSGQLDARFYLLRDGVEQSKERCLVELMRILAEERVQLDAVR